MIIRATPLSLTEYQALMQNAQVLSRDEFGDKVLRLASGMIVKLFRRKRLISSTWFRPYAQRFVSASRELKTLGIPSADVETLYRIRALHRDAVAYPELVGETLRSAIAQTRQSSDGARRDALMQALAGFMAKLHSKGVYFRAIHLGNVLVMANGELALIDISEVRFRNGPLPLGLRSRNFKPLLSYPEDVEVLLDFGVERFISIYLSATELSEAKRIELGQLLQLRLPMSEPHAK